MPRIRYLLFTAAAAAACVVLPSPSVAQSAGGGAPSSTAESAQHPPRTASGVSVGTVMFASGAAEEALSGIAQFQPRDWLTVSLTPAMLHVTDSTRTYSTSGLGDLPLEVDATHALHAPWSPDVGLALGATLPVGDSLSGLGTGHMGLSMSAGVDVAPTDVLSVHVGAWHELSGSGSASALAATPTSLEGEVSWSLGRTTATLGATADLGHAADTSEVPSRGVAGGVAYALSGPLTLTVDAGHGLTRTAPAWSLSIGIGTAFAGLNPVGATSPLGRMRGAFGQVIGGRGYGMTHGGSCRATRTC